MEGMERTQAMERAAQGAHFSAGVAGWSAGGVVAGGVAPVGGSMGKAQAQEEAGRDRSGEAMPGGTWSHDNFL
jgi:hypothetical protein